MERRLLMIDDDIALGKLVQEFLTGEGWSCYWVDNGEEGRVEFHAHCIFSDSRMQSDSSTSPTQRKPPRSNGLMPF